METLFVKPVAGAKVRNPDRQYQFLPAEGEAVPRSAYWLRRLADGSVEQATPPKRRPTRASTRASSKTKRG